MLLVIYHYSKKLLDYKLSIAHTFSNTLAYKKSSVFGWLFYYIKLSSFNKLYNVGLKLNSFIKSLTSFKALSFFSFDIFDFDALIKIFLGEWDISINSNNWVLYPKTSN